MEKYNEYKDSGVQWLGKIPSHWGLRKMKYTFSERSQKGFPNEPLLAATQSHGVILKSQYETRTVEATKSLETLKLVEIGDFVISLRSFQGGLEYAHERGIISPAYTILTPTHISAEYFRYLSKSNIFISLLKSTVTGIREGQNIDYNKLKDNLLPIPPIEEQVSIGLHLDKVISELDKAIAMQQKMIDLLNERKQIIIQDAVTKGLDGNAVMKDSGIDSIGRIPRGWTIKKLKYVMHSYGRIGFRGYGTKDIVDEGQGAITLSPSNIQNSCMDYSKKTYLSWNKYFESPEIMIKNKDVLMVKTGSSFGKCAVVKNMPMECTINPQLVVFKEHTEVPEYVAYCFQSSFAKFFINTSVIGGTIPTISQDKINNYIFPFPMKDEQQKIVAYLDSKMLKIDKVIDNCQRQISLLQERKQIIINEVVTGKVRVS